MNIVTSKLDEFQSNFLKFVQDWSGQSKEIISQKGSVVGRTTFGYPWNTKDGAFSCNVNTFIKELEEGGIYLSLEVVYCKEVDFEHPEKRNYGKVSFYMVRLGIANASLNGTYRERGHLVSIGYFFDLKDGEINNQSTQVTIGESYVIDDTQNLPESIMPPVAIDFLRSFLEKVDSKLR